MSSHLDLSPLTGHDKVLRTDCQLIPLADTQAPSTAITSPKSLVLNTISPVFTLSGDDGTTGTGIDHFECKLEAQGQVAGNPSAADSVANSTGMLVNPKLHDWETCGVSTSFQQLPNGLYK